MLINTASGAGNVYSWRYECFSGFWHRNVVISDIAASRGGDNTAKAKKTFKRISYFSDYNRCHSFCRRFYSFFLPTPNMGGNIRTEVKIASFLVIINAAKTFL